LNGAHVEIFRREQSVSQGRFLSAGASPPGVVVTGVIIDGAIVCVVMGVTIDGARVCSGVGDSGVEITLAGVASGGSYGGMSGAGSVTGVSPTGAGATGVFVGVIIGSGGAAVGTIVGGAGGASVGT